MLMDGGFAASLDCRCRCEMRLWDERIRRLDRISTNASLLLENPDKGSWSTCRVLYPESRSPGEHR